MRSAPSSPTFARRHDAQIFVRVFTSICFFTAAAFRAVRDAQCAEARKMMPARARYHRRLRRQCVTPLLHAISRAAASSQQITTRSFRYFSSSIDYAFIFVISTVCAAAFAQQPSSHFTID